MAMVIKKAKTPEEIAARDERYTKWETLLWCLEKTKVTGYTLDVAACEAAHVAERYYTKEMNGLSLPWTGHVWCNPPFSNIGPWVEKAWFHAAHSATEPAQTVSMLLPATRTEQPWWQDQVEPYRDRPDSILRVHFIPGRVSFTSPEDPLGKNKSPPFTCCLLVWRRP